MHFNFSGAFAMLGALVGRSHSRAQEASSQPAREYADNANTAAAFMGNGGQDKWNLPKNITVHTFTFVEDLPEAAGNQLESVREPNRESNREIECGKESAPQSNAAHGLGKGSTQTP